VTSGYEVMKCYEVDINPLTTIPKCNTILSSYFYSLILLILLFVVEHFNYSTLITFSTAKTANEGTAGD
jgi:hypothetical protein